MTRAAPATASWRPASRCCSSSCWPLPRPASPRLAPYPARPCSCSASPAASRPRRTVLKRRRGSRLPLRPCGWWCTTAAPRAGCRTPPSACSRRSRRSRRRRRPRRRRRQAAPQQLRAALRGVPGGRAGRRGGAPAPGVPPPLPRRLRRRLAARAPDLPALPLRPLPAERHLEGCRPSPGRRRRRRRHGGVLARRPAAGVRTRSSPVHRNLGGASVIPTVHS
uniref:Uncharacterized protein n=1 Tax=Setaria viridis TaxID=4556 RepID=A0A4V6DAU5_SETVI|nr:hypothetical protein SEVIR_2G090701v2 [Setaria viridis]